MSERELELTTPLLVETGSGRLAWPRVRHSELRATPAAGHLQSAYLHHTFGTSIRERHLERIVTHLRSTGVEPLVAKGWAMGRLYPERGMRPYGDIDLCVRPEQQAAAASALFGPSAPSNLVEVDLNDEFHGVDDRSWDQLYGRSQLVSLRDAEVRVLGPEDHLRFLSLHLLYHGGRRPRLLCDMALLLESLPPDFDWDYCLSGDGRRAEWVVQALGLAHQVLGARWGGAPEQVGAHCLPGRLVPSVWRQWGTGYRYCTSPMAAHLRHPRGVVEAIRQRWPNPIEATIGLRGPWNGLPRRPYQLAYFALRGVSFAIRLLRAQATPDFSPSRLAAEA